jgi:dTDP-4-amino-4,6-dideoxygalactose transaminase
MTIPMTDLTLQYQSIKGEIDAAMRAVVEGGQFILGSEVKAFEEEMTAYCGTGFAVGVASGTDALRLALLACGIGQGDEVITTPFTFIATVETICKCGARPVFADIDPRTCNIDVEQITSKITSRTKALLPVHLYGQPAAMSTILDVAAAHKLKVIEDCAQAVGAEYEGKKVGSLGDVGCLSFFPAKNLGAFGDGGMVVTNNDDIADRVRVLRGHGARTSYYHTMHGFNSRLDALQAAVLRVKLKHLEQWNAMRRANTKLYNQLLGEIEGVEPVRCDGPVVPSCNYYTVRITNPRLDRQKLRAQLDSRGIQTNVYYPLSLHLQEVYRDLGYKSGDFPQSERAQNEVLSLPMYPELRKEEIERVAAEIALFAHK